MTTELREMLAAADGLPAACSAVVDHLLTRGFDLPSLYLEHAGRLRLHAQRGYWQVQDGFPTTAGIMGQVFTSGESVQVRVADAQHYVGAATGVVEELSVPIRLDGQVVGVLNIESRSALPSVAQRPLEDSSAHQLVRHAVSLHALSTEAEIWRYTVEAGRGLSNMTAAVAVARDADGTPTVAAAAGPIGERLRQLTAATWTAISEWTAQGTSCYTVGDPAGSGFAGHTALRAPGSARGGRRGIGRAVDVYDRSAGTVVHRGRQLPGNGGGDVPAASASDPRPVDGPAQQNIASRRIGTVAGRTASTSI
jgi:putative methionine-R-sulfoxide reductase with GAF domain